jgi:hypothetical protein
MAGLGEAPVGHRAAAIGGAAGTARREAAARRQAAQIRRATADRVDVALTWLTVHGRGEQSCRVGVRRRPQDAGDGSALDDAAGIHDRDRVGDLGGDAEIVRHENHAHAELALQPAQQ